MDKTLFCGIDLHSNNAVYVITDEQDRQLFRKRLPNELPVVLAEEKRGQALDIGAVSHIQSRTLSVLPTNPKMWSDRGGNETLSGMFSRIAGG